MLPSGREHEFTSKKCRGHKYHLELKSHLITAVLGFEHLNDVIFLGYISFDSLWFFNVSNH